MDRLNRTFNDVSDKVDDLDINVDWRKRTLLIGGVIGAALGLLSSYFYIRAADDAKHRRKTDGPEKSRGDGFLEIIDLSQIAADREQNALAEIGDQRTDPLGSTAIPLMTVKLTSPK